MKPLTLKSSALYAVVDKITELATSDEFKTNLTNTVENIVNTYIHQLPEDLKCEISKFVHTAVENNDEFYDMVDTIAYAAIEDFFHKDDSGDLKIDTEKCPSRICEGPFRFSSTEFPPRHATIPFF